jgi:cation transport ATPase
VWGARLGGPEAPYWVGILQGLLAGWVVYVSGAGMLVEGLLRMTMRRRPGVDFFVAAVAIGLYVAGAVDYAGLLIRGKLMFPLTFVWSALLLLLWSAGRWWWQRRSARGAS